MRSVYTLLTIILLSLSAIAQQDTVPRDILHMQGGYAIIGHITARTPTTIRIDVKGKEQTIDRKEIAEIDVERTKYNRPHSSPAARDTFEFKKRGYTGSVEIGISELFGPRNGIVQGQQLFSCHIVNAYQASPLFAIGIGVGADVAGRNGFMLPVYEDMRIYFRHHATSPFIELPFGYNGMVAMTQTTINGYTSSGYRLYNGIMFNPSFGVRSPIWKNKLAVLIQVGYKLWDQHLTLQDDYNSYDIWVIRNGFNAKVGLDF